MVFAVSEGRVLAVEKPTYQAPTALRINDDLTQDYAEVYRKQPEVRTVVDFLARNIAQLSLHTFRRVSDTDRQRLRDHPVAQLLGHPNSFTTPYEQMRSLVADRGIYDFGVWLKTLEQGRDALIRIPPTMIRLDEKDENWLRPSRFIVKGSRGETAIDASNFVYFHGYNPEDSRQGLSPIETLRRALSEAWAAGQMREQILRNGARTSGYLTRPVSATAWSDEARTRFKQGWRNQYQGASATEAGGTPVLEDGMTFVPASQTAEELQYVEARKLTREEVAAAYHIPPPMVGLLDHATFGNIEEQHKMLYQDTLGPWLTEIQQRIGLDLLPAFGDSEGIYVEFNMQEKLRGSFEEQAAQLQTSVGAPFMTRNEARSRANLPSIPGGDALIVPLNVLEGGQASPTDSAPDGQASYLRIPWKMALPFARTKARPPAQYQAKAAEVLRKFFARQEQTIKSALGAKADADWWNESRWNDELSAALYAVSTLITTEVARKQLEDLGIDPDEYDVDRTLAYLVAASKSNASSINAATKQQIEAALDGEDDPVDAVGHVFDVAKDARADQGGLTLVTAMSAFASVEAVTQVAGPGGATKTWQVTSTNPRSSHARLDGETVPLDDVFSNGAKWPGDTSALDVDEVAGCTCDVVIQIG